MNIGIFDSGLGGLTIIKTMLENLHGVEMFYIADTANAPYGEKTKEQIIDFSTKITQYFIDKFQIDALVVACNTATSAAIKELREQYPDLIIIGTEPGLKPAISHSHSKKVGILATPATLNGEKYKLLRDELSKQYKVDVFEQACPGLVQQIELGELDTPKTLSLLEGWLAPMREADVDTIVLGCTHYPLVGESIKKVMQRDVKLVETSHAITKRVDELCHDSMKCKNGNSLKIFSTGEISQSMIEMILTQKYYITHIKI
ncbi:MAG: glutamate racemase [Sulfurovaceae bacterium]|nr:glutamate racemase [Sulfurovaceae bacterium]MDD5549484.1 glutamate racemase [Sulfurovaceae bacterium]